MELVLDYNLTGFDLRLIFSKVSFLIKDKDKLSDDELIEFILNGENKAFECLFDRYNDLVLGYSYQFTKRKEAAEEICQEIWMRVLKALEHYERQGKFKSWLLQMTRNKSIDYLRLKSNQRYEEVNDEISEDFNQTTFDNELENQENRQKLKAAIENLSESQRIAINLWMVEELSFEQIAQELDVNINTAKSLVHRARNTIKQQLGAA